MPHNRPSKSRSGKDMLKMLQNGPKNGDRDKAQAQVVDAILETTRVQDDERAKADSFAEEMGMEAHMHDAGVRRAFIRDGADEFKSERIPSPDEYSLASTQVVPRPLLRELLEGSAPAAHFPHDTLRRSRWTGDLLYGFVNLEGLGTSAKLQRSLTRRGRLASEQLDLWLPYCANRDLAGVQLEDEAALEDIEFVDQVISGL